METKHACFADGICHSVGKAGRNATGIGSVSLPVPDDLLDEELWEKLLRYMSRCSDGGSRVAGSRRARLDGPWLTGPFEPCP